MERVDHGSYVLNFRRKAKREIALQSHGGAVDVSSAFMTLAATNSPHLRVKVGSVGGTGASRILYGHTDVVLSVANFQMGKFSYILLLQPSKPCSAASWHRADCGQSGCHIDKRILFVFDGCGLYLTCKRGPQ